VGDPKTFIAHPPSEIPAAISLDARRKGGEVATYEAQKVTIVCAAPKGFDAVRQADAAASNLSFALL